MELSNPIKTIKIGKSTKLKIKLPDEFIQNEGEKHNDAVCYFNPINDDYFIITIERKYLFEEDLMLSKYGEMIIIVIGDGKTIDIKEIKMVKENIYELNLTINRVRCCGLVKILETNNEFLTVRVFSGIKNYTVHKNKYLEMFDSISV